MPTRTFHSFQQLAASMSLLLLESANHSPRELPKPEPAEPAPRVPKGWDKIGTDCPDDPEPIKDSPPESDSIPVEGEQSARFSLRIPPRLRPAASRRPTSSPSSRHAAYHEMLRRERLRRTAAQRTLANDGRRLVPTPDALRAQQELATIPPQERVTTSAPPPIHPLPPEELGTPPRIVAGISDDELREWVGTHHFPDRQEREAWQNRK